MVITMGKNHKRSWQMYSAWNYEKEIEDLNKASEQGWQLVKGGLFSNTFEKNPDLRWRYQMDYGAIEDMGRYIETFREQGWEYVNSTFNHWHYFRKAWDPALPEMAYEIFTDRESLQEMNNRWANLALLVTIILTGLAVFYGVRLARRFQLPNLILFLSMVLEIAVLLRGRRIMRNPHAGRNRRHDSVWLKVFFAIVILCSATAITLTVLRPSFSTEQNADALDAPIVDNRWVDFTVKYPDSYYLDLEMDAEKPMTFSIYNEAGEIVYTRTETNFQEENIKLRLHAGTYSFSVTSETGFRVAAKID